MKQTRYLKKIIPGLILFAAAVILQVAARNSTGFANWYTAAVYPYLVSSIGRVFGILPFSAAELLLYALLLFLLGSAANGIRLWVTGKKAPSDVLLSGCGNVILLTGTLFFIYTGTCGINYHRDTFSEMNGLELRKYSVEQLREYCGVLTEEVNRLSEEKGEKETKASGEDAVKAMENLGNQYETLRGYYPKPKPVAVSEILSYQHLTGVYSPFTVEANYNADMTAYNIPFTMCHELSHLRGYMREDEANYIAWLACSQSEEITFRYSGALMAWIYSTNLLYEYDREAYEELDQRLNEEVQEDLAKNSAFWDRYEGRVSELSDQVNDTYLKANKQTDGVESYDRMVDLLMAGWLKEKEGK